MRKETWKWFGAVVAAGLASASAASAVQNYLLVVGGIANFDCGTQGTNNFYYAEALGYTAGGVRMCEVSTRISATGNFTATGLCTGNGGTTQEGTQHTEQIVVRSNADGLRVGAPVLAPAAAPLPAWATPTTRTVTIAAHGTCGPTLLVAQSKGLGSI